MQLGVAPNYTLSKGARSVVYTIVAFSVAIESIADGIPLEVWEGGKGDYGNTSISPPGNGMLM